jgi:hypothetical protein
MAVFGGYETVRELYRSGLASTHAARKTGEDTVRFVIKAYQPPSAEIDPERFQQEVENFLDGARAQKACCDRKAPHWATLHEAGTVEDGAYFVTDLQPRSIKPLIEGKTKLDGNALCQILTSVVQGLIELRDACNRPHGNLKPTNVLLTANMQVLLTDPLGSRKLPSQTGNVADMHAIGELIYLLVMHRPVPAIAGSHGTDSPEWRRLAKSAEWRQLCGRLLNQNLESNLHQLEDLLEDLRKLRAAGGGAKRAVIAAVAAVVLAGVGFGVYKYLAPPPLPPVKFDANAWQSACQQFGDWVEPMLGALEGGGLNSWDKDPYLKGKARPILDKISKGDMPKDISGQAGREVTESVRSSAGARRTRKVLDDYESFKAALTSQEWDAHVLMVKAADDFHARGWVGSEAYLRGRLAFPGKDVGAWVDQTLSVKGVLIRVGTGWKKVQDLCAVIQLKGWGEKSEADPSLKKIDEYVLAETRLPGSKNAKQSLDELAAKLEELSSDDRLLSRLARCMQSERAKKLDMALMRAEPPFTLPASGAIGDEVLRNGLKKLEDGYYDPLVDNRQAWEPKATGELNDLGPTLSNLSSDVAKQIDGLADTKLKDKEGKVLKDKYGKDLDGVLADVKQNEQKLGNLKSVLTKVSVKAVPVYDHGTRQAIDSGKTEIDTGLKDMAAKVATTKQAFVAICSNILRDKAGTLKDIQEGLRKLNSISAIGNSDIDAAWVAQRDALLAGEKTGEGLFEKAGRLRKFLQDLEALFPQDLGAKVEQRPWNAALTAAELDRRRKEAIASALTYVTWDKASSGQADDAFIAPRDKLVKDYQDWRAGVVVIVPGLNQVQDFLNVGYLLSEKPAALTTTLDEFYASLAGKPVFADRAVQAAAKPIVDRVTALKQLSASNDPQALLTAVSAGKQGQFEAARAAWVRLGELVKGKAWLTKGDDLRQEVECRKNLAAVYGQVADPARKAALQKELADESRKRWEAYFVSRSDVKDIQDAVARMQGFGLTVADRATLSPLGQFRLDMYDLLYAVGAEAGAVDDETVKKAVAQFRGKAAALPPAFAQRVNLKSIVDPLAEVEAATGGTVNLAQAGPAAKGWKVDSEAGDQVVYSWPGHAHNLTFYRVTPKGGKPGFLCATEVSVGLFLDVLASNQKQADMAKLLLKDGDINGPRTWVRKGGGLALSGVWLEPSVALEKTLYSPKVTPDNPTSAHPIQQVSLAGAIYLASLMNCRLPTAGEWADAYLGVDKQAKTEKPYNLRDKTWQVQKDYLVKLEAEGTATGLFFPDAGIFWPKGVQPKGGSEAEVARDAKTDGVLWFAKVNSDPHRAFQNLVGNVAEFVYEDPDALVALKGPTGDAVRQFVTTGAAQARVIGGSALSAPTVPVDQPQELAAGADGFSDVGFRLAFFAGREPLQNRVLRLLKAMQNQGYLAPPAATP